MFFPYYPAIILLGIYWKELKTYVHTKTCTKMFIAALFIIAKAWKQQKCPSVCEQINKFWYIQAVEYYSALKRNEISSHEKIWKNLKCILLSERNQSEKATYCLTPTILTFLKRQNWGDSWKVSGCQGLAREMERWIGRAQRVFRTVKILYDTIMMNTCHFMFV